MQLQATMCQCMCINECLQDMMRHRVGEKRQKKAKQKALYSMSKSCLFNSHNTSAIAKKKIYITVFYSMKSLHYAARYNCAFLFWRCFLFALKPHTAQGVLWSYLKLQRTTSLGWANSHVSLADLLHGRKRDCDKRHICAVQAQCSALLGVKNRSDALQSAGTENRLCRGWIVIKCS